MSEVKNRESHSVLPVFYFIANWIFGCFDYWGLDFLLALLVILKTRSV